MSYLKAVVQLVLLIALSPVLGLLVFVGAVAGLAWASLRAGFGLWDSVLGWVIADKQAWTQPEPPQ